jgi:hypothetical protein
MYRFMRLSGQQGCLPPIDGLAKTQSAPIGYSPRAIDQLLADLYIESHAAAPKQIVLDLDATDIPLYGYQPERFFHGYYDSYCYLLLYIFSGDQLLCARLRPPTRMPLRARSTRSSASWLNCASAGPSGVANAAPIDLDHRYRWQVIATC